MCVMCVFQGAHITLNAYSEDDVDPDEIMNKVFQSVGDNYSIQTETDHASSTKALRSVVRFILNISRDLQCVWNRWAA